MKTTALLLAVLLATPAFAATTKNDDSCDIAVLPAATLLLPYFEVDFKSPPERATQTLFTIQNVSPLPQIAHVTLWTDWGYPALNFFIFLTGYDVQGINLYDVFANGVIVPPFGTSSLATLPVNPSPSSQPAANTGNPNITTQYCTNLPGRITPYLRGLQNIFTTGMANDLSFSSTCSYTTTVGGAHQNAIGYATVDVFAACTPAMANEPDFWRYLLYDNVLTGDYQQLLPRGGRITVQGGPLVHIRAIPEGGPAGAAPGTELTSTFYERYTNGAPQPRMDRRQPLPSLFAPRFIAGGAGGFNTTLKIWHRGVVPAGAPCSAYANNRALWLVDAIRFDEHENATAVGAYSGITIPVPPPPPPVTFATSVDDTWLFPQRSQSGDVGGWLYLNFGDQAWVIGSMFSESINGTDASAVALGNGCSPPLPAAAPIGPTP